MSENLSSVNRPGRAAGYVLLSAATAAGVWAILGTLRDGHLYTATTQHVPWGLWVALYIFFLGLSAGSFLLSTLIYVFGVKRLEPAGPLALLQALLCLVLGGVLIVLDLGHPARVYLVLFSMNTSSVMAWMGFFYNFYILIVLAELYFALRPYLVRKAETSAWCRLLALGSRATDAGSVARDKAWLKVLGILGIPVAITVHGGVGMIFAVAKARPGWFGGLFPIIFLISALASGGALLTFLTAAFSKLPREKKKELVRLLMKLTIGILCFDLLLLGSEILTTYYGSMPHAISGWRATLFGPFWWVFWFVQLLCGALVPIAIMLSPAARQSTRWQGFAGLLVVIGIVGTRLNIVIPPQIEPMFSTLPQAYAHPRFAAGYFPSGEEWLVALGVIALGFWAFLLANKILPLKEAELAEVMGQAGATPQAPMATSQPLPATGGE